MKVWKKNCILFHVVNLIGQIHTLRSQKFFKCLEGMFENVIKLSAGRCYYRKNQLGINIAQAANIELHIAYSVL